MWVGGLIVVGIVGGLCGLGTRVTIRLAGGTCDGWKLCLSGENGPESGEILRDGIASGRGVHRFWGCPIQKSRSNFRGKMEKSRNSGISGVGVV